MPSSSSSGLSPAVADAAPAPAPAPAAFVGVLGGVDGVSVVEAAPAAPLLSAPAGSGVAPGVEPLVVVAAAAVALPAVAGRACATGVLAALSGNRPTAALLRTGSKHTAHTPSLYMSAPAARCSNTTRVARLARASWRLEGRLAVLTRRIVGGASPRAVGDAAAAAAAAARLLSACATATR